MRLKTLSLLILMSASFSAQSATNYIIKLPSGGSVSPSLNLTASTLPDASEAESYTYDLSNDLTIENVQASALTWSATDLPSGLSLSASGILSGTPLLSGSESISITVSSENLSGDAVFALTINSSSWSAVSVSRGQSNTCAISTTGALRCWGRNNKGQLGYGPEMGSRHVPTLVPGMTSGVTDVSVGYSHICAVQNGGAKCWGNNAHGELGNNSIVNKNVPTPVHGLGSGIRQVASGYVHSCAITTSNQLKCWGGNASSQLGQGNTTERWIPVNTRSSVSTVALGQNSSCLINTSGTPLCFGYAGHTQMGDGSTTTNTSPSGITGISSGGSSVAMGPYNGSAIVSGALKVWGFGLYGVSPSATPVTLTGMTSGVTKAALSNGNGYAIKNGAVYAWGKTGGGAMGDGGTTNVTQSTPLSVPGLTSGVTDISSGAASGHGACAIKSGKIYCWGSGGHGINGDGDDAINYVPVLIN